MKLTSIIAICLLPIISYGQKVVTNKPIPAKFSGVWKGNKDCDLAAGAFSIAAKNPVDIEVNSNQIYISANAIVSDENPNVIRFYLVKPEDLGRGGMALDWEHFSKDVPIAEATYLTPTKMKFKWNGFYNGTTKKTEWSKEGDWVDMEGFDNHLYKCN